MSREFPDWVNPLKAAEGNRIYRGTIALSNMTRLVPMLTRDSGEVAFEAAFFRDRLGFAVLNLKVSAQLTLTCQASLETYLESVERDSMLAVIVDLKEQDELPGHYEAVLIESGRLEFLSLVQDELILAVPQVPRKPGLEEVQYSTDPKEDFEHLSEEPNKPFAALGALLQNEHSEEDQD
jgi:uncharacterized protein